MLWVLKSGIKILNSTPRSFSKKFWRKFYIFFLSVLGNDLPRTRANEEFFKKESTRRNLRSLTTFYCKSNNVNYQQGLLEVCFIIYINFCEGNSLLFHFYCWDHQNFDWANAMLISTALWGNSIKIFCDKGLEI